MNPTTSCPFRAQRQPRWSLALASAFLLVIILAPPGRLVEASPDPDREAPAPGGFAAQVETHFAGWDLDHDGALSFRELGTLVPDVRIRDEAAAALAAIHRVQRGKNPRWHHAAFTRSQLLAPRDEYEHEHEYEYESGAEPPPPFARDYRQDLAHIRATRRVLFSDGAPRLSGIHQGPLGDCFLIATVGAAVARDPNALRALFAAPPEGEGTDRSGFVVRFRGGPAVPVPSISDAEVALGSTDGRQGLWLNVIEKAYGELVCARRGFVEPALDALSGTGTAAHIIQLLTGHEGLHLRFRPHGAKGPRHTELAALVPRARTLLIEATQQRRLTCCGTSTAATPPGIIRNHMYAVLGFDPDQDSVHLWNPWGNHFTPDGPPGLDSGYPVRDGHFTLPLADFVRIFTALISESQRPAPLARRAGSSSSSR
jgi:hypothetical protein